MTELRIVVIKDRSEIDVTESVKVVYDCTVSSLNYGSGFLSNEEMEQILVLARAIDADNLVEHEGYMLRMKWSELNGLYSNPSGVSEYAYTTGGQRHDFKAMFGGKCCEKCGYHQDSGPHFGVAIIEDNE